MKLEESYLMRIGGAFSQLINVLLLNGHPDESISGRVYRLRLQNPDVNKYKTMVKVIDTIFFLDPDHCFSAYHGDLAYARMRLDMHEEIMSKRRTHVCSK